MRDVINDAVATHGHPRAIIGATAYAYAAWWLLRAEHTIGFGELVEQINDNIAVWGELPASGHAKNGWLDAANQQSQGRYEGIWRDVVSEMRELVSQVRAGIDAGAIGDDHEVLRRLGCFGKAKGSGTISTAAAVYLIARYAAQPAQAVVSAAFARGADTDTMAAMTGGLAGCLAGYDWLPRDWLSVQDSDYVRRLANTVAQESLRASEAAPVSRTISQKELDALRAALARRGEDSVDLDGSRRVRVMAMVALKSLSSDTIAQAWQLETSDGQTLYINKLGRKSKEKPQRQDTDRHNDVGQPMTAAAPETQAMSIRLSVADVSASASFYERAIGLVPTRKTQKLVSYGPLSLVEGRHAVDLSGGTIKLDQPNGRNLIEIPVHDLEAAQRRLSEYQVHPARPVAAGRRGDRTLHVIDPDGNVVELIERRDR